MSFYDLTKDNVLSANELFKYRLKRDATVPSKGGQKAFEPDGSWIHAKTLESFMQERTKILGEQRVEKLKSLVQGVWEEKKRLVSLSKPGKFWAHMGFTDKRRNWLYPEEALFLMETNTLEVYCNGLPLSLQEAYSNFMGPDLSLEEYQVFAHLRRLGYVVLRQEAELDITPYEKQINLDKYMTKQSRKERKEKLLEKKKTQENNPTKETLDDSEEKNTNTVETPFLVEKGSEKGYQPQGRFSDESTISSLGNDDVNEKQNVRSDESLAAPCPLLHAKRSSAESLDSPEGSPQKKLKTNDQPAESSELLKSFPKAQCLLSDNQPHMFWYQDAAWAQCFQNSQSPRTSGESLDKDFPLDSKTKPASSTEDLSNTDPAQTFPFPTIADKSLISLPQPWAKLLPRNVEVNEDYRDVLMFNVEKYRREVGNEFQFC
ncbi:tRNA-splicing endonuclease subunit Sen54 [Elysia marginata]|uniref:tRNA-splicing endonuclease subunit Sen54 n=1 Tax=Elysia marginata TaxID=1093978 RepID=A0AAV4GF46_9GAST|nr:tRNA-splicing endonuclease subunit Sen54 [Elysia marginata]